MHPRFLIGFFLFVLFLLPGLADGADSVVPGSILTDTTSRNIGIRWQVVGDDDLDAVCTVRFRLQGTPTWQTGLPLFRSSPAQTGGENRLAGSIFFLESNSSYEIELTLSDADGGGGLQVVTVTTAAELGPPVSPVDYWVEPGSGGGTGVEQDPFLGLQEAADQAHPGAVFHVAAGSYEPFTLIVGGVEGSPVVFRGPVKPQNDPVPSHWAIVDGGGTAISGIDLGNGTDPIAYLVFENLVIQDVDFGVVARNTQQLLFIHNLVRDVDSGFFNNRELGLEQHQVLSDNTFIGRESWPGTGFSGPVAIHLRGTANEVLHNSISYFAEGILVAPVNPEADGSDVSLNDLYFIVSDPIQIADYAANTRIWRNRVTNAGSGVNFYAVRGGPVYVFRNECFNLDYTTYKAVGSPAGLVILHNTSRKLEIGIYSSDPGWESTFLRNNIVLGTDYIVFFPFLITGPHDWDYDGLGTSGAGAIIRWDDEQFYSITEFTVGTGLEVHGISASADDLVDAVLPANYGDGVAVGSYDLRLAAATPEIDTGAVLANINDPFVSDGLPDRGAFEFGSDLPEYGPRPWYPAAVDDLPAPVQAVACLYPAAPNPFNPRTTLAFELREQMTVSLRVYDLSGQLVDVLLNQQTAAQGRTEVVWRGRDMDGRVAPAGVYFYRLEAGSYSETKRMVLIK